MANVVGSAPTHSSRGDGYALAVWATALPGMTELRSNRALLGSVRGLPDDVGVHNASRLPGDYALIAGQPNGLLLARGRLAGRCLYAARTDRGVVAACSRLEPLIAVVGRVTANVRTLAALILAEGSDDFGATVFREVRRVEASQAIVVGSSGVVDSDQAKLESTPRSGRPDELAEALRAALHRAVQRSIEGRRKVGVLVSGGLDSSCVLAHAVAIARGAGRPEVDAINLSFAGHGDDRPYFKDLCDALGIVPVQVAPAEASRQVVRALTADAAPTISPAAAWDLTLRERARDRGAEVVLTGNGGDHVFNGDPRIFARRALKGHLFDAFRRAVRFQRQSRASIPRAFRYVVSPPVISVAPGIQRARRRRSAIKRWPWAGPRLREVIEDLYVQKPPDLEWTSSTSAPRFERLVRKEFMYLAEHRGQAEAASAIVRVNPLWDDELVALTAGFPQEVLLHGDRWRGLFRLAMPSIVPDSVRLRPDKAWFEPAIAEMVGGSDLGALRDLARMQMLGDLGLVEPARYRLHFEAVLSAGSESLHWLAIWPALAVEAFARSQWNKAGSQTPCPPSP
jgi:asparagine synthase (glutamine-hydrolysing)